MIQHIPRFGLSHWHSRSLDLASHVASWSKDPSTKAGACIVDSRHRVLSLGFNGFPRGTHDHAQVYDNRPRKYLRVIHAEKNAMMFAMCDLTGTTIYSSHAPCAQCMAAIIQCGITTVVCPVPTPEFRERWGANIIESEELVRESNIHLIYVTEF